MLFSRIRIAPRRVQSLLLGTFSTFQAASDCIDAMLRQNGSLRLNIIQTAAGFDVAKIV